ncbi:hypothetical protein FHU28_003982 [Micromonospora echinospora]|uniref:ABC transporter permease n=1 Tax=Micromonospora echinospora TaxID=1877 RepID=A0ABR6MFI1_MICEC|nr:hypothetical protein [Micromonospora echinospora]
MTKEGSAISAQIPAATTPVRSRRRARALAVAAAVATPTLIWIVSA